MSEQNSAYSCMKFSALNDNKNDCINQLLINTTTLLQKTSKLQNSMEEVYESVQSTSSKDTKLRRSIDNINNHIEELQTLSKSSVKTTTNNRAKNTKKTASNCDIKKKIFSDTSSSSSSDDSEDSSSGDSRTKTTPTIDKQLCNLTFNNWFCISFFFTLPFQ